MTDEPKYTYVRRSDLPPVDKPDLFQSSGIGELIAEEAPWMGQLFMQFMTSIMPFMRGYYISGSRTSDEIIFTQSISDANALFVELSEGSGRSAVRTSRSLVECAINIKWVLNNPQEATLYQEYLELMPLFEDEFANSFRFPGRKISVKLKKKSGHAYKKSKSRILALLAQRGARFKSNWTTMNLADRADRVGLSYLYSSYRLLSLVAHGAPGAIFGLRKNITGVPVVRTGADISSCSLAYIVGARALQEILNAVEGTRSDLSLLSAGEVLDIIIDCWPDFVSVIGVVDGKIWPKEAPEQVTAVLGISQRGYRRWYWYDPAVGVIIEADPPILESDQEESIGRIVRHIMAKGDHFFQGGQQFATVRLDHIAVSPKSDAPMMPATAILIDPREIID